MGRKCCVIITFLDQHCNGFKSEASSFSLQLRVTEACSRVRHECYLSGDINIDLLKYDVNNKHRDFLNMVTSFGYLPYIIHPTRITENTSTLIDNIWLPSLYYTPY